MTGVLFDPAKAFADIAARPRRWWAPLILVALVSLVFVYAYSSRVGWERLIRSDIESNSRLQNLTPEQRENAVQQGMKFASISGYVMPVVAPFVGVLVVGGILMFVMNSLMGAQVTFAQSRAIVAYSFLTGVISGILSIVIMFLKNPEDFDIRNPLAFNGGAFLPESAAKWMVSLGSSIDVFSFWTMALMATGFVAASRKMAWSKAFTGVLMAWGVYVVLKVGGAAIFS